MRTEARAPSSSEPRKNRLANSTITGPDGRPAWNETSKPTAAEAKAMGAAIKVIDQTSRAQNEAATAEMPDDAFARSLVFLVTRLAPEFDTRVCAVSEGSPADRLGTLERNILRIGVFELEENAVPMDVAINEAVVLAKRYASEDAARLVNGILGRIAKDGR